MGDSVSRDDGHGRDGGGWELLGIVLWAGLVTIAVVLKIEDSGTLDFFVKHPVAAGIVSGGLILAPLVWLVERLVQRRERERDERRAAAEARRWHEPARDSVEVYLRSARRGATADPDFVAGAYLRQRPAVAEPARPVSAADGARGGRRPPVDECAGAGARAAGRSW